MAISERRIVITAVSNSNANALAFIAQAKGIMDTIGDPWTALQETIEEISGIGHYVTLAIGFDASGISLVKNSTFVDTDGFTRDKEDVVDNKKAQRDSFGDAAKAASTQSFADHGISYCQAKEIASRALKNGKPSGARTRVVFTHGTEPDL